MHGLAIGLAIGLLIAVLTLLGCYEYFGRPSKVPELPLLIGDIRRARAEAEAIVRSADSRWRDGLVADHEMRSGADLYRGLASRCDGIAATLEAMLSAGHDESMLSELKNRLAQAQARYDAFRGWGAGLSKGGPVQTSHPQAPANGPILYGAGPGDIATGAIQPGVDLGKHVIDKMVELDREKRIHLIEMLRDSRFPAWQAIADGRGIAPDAGTMIALPPAPPAPPASPAQPRKIWPRRQRPM